MAGYEKRAYLNYDTPSLFGEECVIACCSISGNLIFPVLGKIILPVGVKGLIQVGGVCPCLNRLLS